MYIFNCFPCMESPSIKKMKMYYKSYIFILIFFQGAPTNTHSYICMHTLYRIYIYSVKSVFLKMEAVGGKCQLGQ